MCKAIPLLQEIKRQTQRLDLNLATVSVKNFRGDVDVQRTVIHVRNT